MVRNSALFMAATLFSAAAFFSAAALQSQITGDKAGFLLGNKRERRAAGRDRCAQSAGGVDRGFGTTLSQLLELLQILSFPNEAINFRLGFGSR
jgi:hypothetical protein